MSHRSIAVTPRRVIALALAAGLAACIAPRALAHPHPHPYPPKDPAPVVTDRRPEVRIALLLDTSNSMDGLIGQAKSQLWSIVNKFSRCDQDGKAPSLFISLYEYGNNSLSPGEGYVRQVLPFTTDLDLLSERLFGLTTNGGSEFCGTVVQKAVHELQWSENRRDLQMIVVAGNEPFTQGDVDYRMSVPEAVRKHIRVNTIFCGVRQEGIETNWQDGASLGRGTFTCIEQDKVVPLIRSPYDDEILKCNAELNATYLPFGVEGEQRVMMQFEQDRNAAARSPAAAAERAISKSSDLYRNSGWDLVDAVKDKKVNLAQMKEEELPEALRALNAPARQERLDQLQASRGKVQARIRELEDARARFVAQQQAAGGKDTLGDALLEAIVVQAREQGFSFK